MQMLGREITSTVILLTVPETDSIQNFCYKKILEHHPEGMPTLLTLDVTNITPRSFVANHPEQYRSITYRPYRKY